MLYGFIACGASNTEVPKAVQKAFDNKFSSATNIEWAIEDGQHIAYFKQDEMEKEARFESDGTWTKTISNLNVKELSACITNYVASEYTNVEVMEASLIEVPDSSKREVIIRTEEEIISEEGEESETVYGFFKLSFNEDCEFIGVEEHNG